MKAVGLITISIIAVCYAATTHKPHTHTHEPNEFESILFQYVPSTHHLVVKQRVRLMYNCYIATLTDKEISHIHTDNGIRSAEIRVLGMLSSATSVDGSGFDMHDTRACGHGHNGTLPQYYTIA